MIFIIIYCALLFAVLVSINVAEFRINSDPMELIGYSKSPATTQKLLININTADLQQLCQLPQIGKTLAKRIIDYREEFGSFYDIEQITQVDGIGEATFERICDLITVD